MATRKITYPKTMPYDEILAELRTVRDRMRDDTRRMEILLRLGAAAPKSSAAALGRAAGVTAQRVSQIAPLRAARAAAAAAPAEPAAPAVESAPPAPAVEPAPAPAPVAPAVEPAAPGAVRELPSIESDADIYVTTVAARTLHRPQRAMRTLIVDASGYGLWRQQPVRLDVGHGSVGEWLTALAALDQESGAAGGPQRVYICGAAPWHAGYLGPHSGPQKKDLVLGWFYAPLPAPWRVDKKGHYTADEDAPVGRYSLSKTRSVEIRGVSDWFNTNDHDYRDVRSAFAMMRTDFRNAFGEGAEFLGGPSTTGKDLWQRTIAKDKEYPVLSEEMRGLIMATSGSGRHELFTDLPDRIPGLYAYDATFAYAALANGLGVGMPTRITPGRWESAGEKEKSKMLYARGRWEVQVTVPRAWDGPGLIQAAGPGKTWIYPSEPGRTWRAWAGGAEIALAIREGWGIRVLDGWTQEEGKPMTKWRDILVTLWQGYQATAAGHEDEGVRRAAKLAAKGVRSVLLKTVGALASHTTSQPIAVRIDGPDAAAIPPGDWEHHPTDAGLIIVRNTRPAAVSPTTHPEWWADIVSRQRGRLLSGPGPIKGQPTGALHLRAGQLVAFRTDALYTTAPQPWANPNRQPGLLRPKGALPFELTAPRTVGELLEYGVAAEQEFENAGGIA
jgi:hypothetical protein